MRGINLVGFQIICRSSQGNRVVLESTETVVTACAEEAANFASTVAVINGKVGDTAASEDCLRLFANGTTPSLDGEHGVILFRSNAKRSSKILSAKIINPYFPVATTFAQSLGIFLVRFSSQWLKILNPAILLGTIAESQLLRGLFAVDMSPDDAVRCYSSSVHINKSHQNRRLGRNWSPVPGNTTKFYLGGVSGRRLPSKSKRMTRVIVEKLAHLFYVDFHCLNVSQVTVFYNE